jgi:hypothetical protein
MADQLDPQLLKLLEELSNNFDRLNTRARNLGDVMEQKLEKKFAAQIDRAVKAAEDAERQRVKSALADKKGMTQKQKDATAESAAKRAGTAVQRQYNENIRQGVISAKEMAQALGKLGSSIYKSEQGTVKYAEAVDTAVTSITALAFLLGGPMIKAIMVVVGGLVKFGKASAEMSDQLFKGYQTLSRSGAVASEGMSGVYQLMQDLRLSTVEIEQLDRIVASTAQSLALFQGTVYQGARAMGQVRRSITTGGLETQFMALGMNTQEINETLGGYIDLYARLGGLEQRNTSQITKSIAEYVRETDAITKLTGSTRKQQEDAQRRAMANEAFSFKIRQLTAKGDAASLKEANRLTMTYRGLAAVSQSAADGFAQMSTGFVTEGGVGAFLITNAKALRAATDSSLTVGDTLQTFSAGLNEGMAGFGDTLAMVNSFQAVTGMPYDELKTLGLMFKDASGNLKEINNEQDLQLLLNDKATKSQVNLRRNELDAMQSMQDFVKLGVAPATTGLATLGSVARNLASMLPGGPPSAAEATAQAANQAAKATAKAQGKGFFGQQIAGMAAGIATHSGGAKAMSQSDLAAMGLRIKQGDVQADNSLIHPKTLALAQAVQSSIQGFNYFSGFNDRYHQEKSPSSTHTSGKAFDFTLGFVPTPEQGRAIADQLRAMGAANVIDEYNNPSSKSTGGHFHVQSLARGGIATGPKSGYMAQLHGTEAVVPLPDNRSIPVEMPDFSGSFDRQIDMMGQQIGRLDELVNLIRDQNSISSQILQVQSN